MNPVNPGSRAPTPTFNAKSSTYLEDLKKEGFISEAQLRAAKSGNVKNMDKADAEVHDTTIEKSRETAEKPSTQKQDKVINTEKDNQALIESENPLTPQQSEVIGAQFNVEHRTRDVALVTKYTKEGYKFVKSSNQDHNCLIISILQHLTKDYSENGIKKHLEDAVGYREKLNDALKKNLSKKETGPSDKFQMLHADNLTFLLSAMKKEKRFKDKDLTVDIWMAGENGEKVSHEMGNGKERVIIFQKTDHFVAVIPSQDANNVNNTASARPALATPTTQASTPVASTVSPTRTSANTPVATPASSHTVHTVKKN